MVGLTHSTYYDVKFHQLGYREIRHMLLADLIADIHAHSRGTYGMLRIRGALENEQGIIVNKKLVWKFAASAPNELWLTDITEHPTREGRVYCCVVLDLFSQGGWLGHRPAL